MPNDSPRNEADVKWNSWRKAMEPTQTGQPPQTPPHEDMQTWDTAQATVYYNKGGQEP